MTSLGRTRATTLPPFNKAIEEGFVIQGEDKTEGFYIEEKDVDASGEITQKISCPIEILMPRIIFFISFLFFSLQFVLAFWGYAKVNGLLALLIAVASFGLLDVVNKVLSIWKVKNAKANTNQNS